MPYPVPTYATADDVNDFDAHCRNRLRAVAAELATDYIEMCRAIPGAKTNMQGTAFVEFIIDMYGDTLGDAVNTLLDHFDAKHEDPYEEHRLSAAELGLTPTSRL